MNIALWNKARKEYYIVSVKSHANEDDAFVTRGKRVSPEGRLIEWCEGFAFETKAEAERKCRDLAKMKARKGKGEVIPLEKLPKIVMNFLEVPPDMQLTPQEMIELLANIEREKYVTFKDLNGMEDLFDPGIQYLGFETEDPEFVKVFDKFGQIRDCLKSRIATTEPTERAIELREKKVKS